jgi:hypothetical protein
MGDDPVPVACFKLEQRVSFSNGAEVEGEACYNTCTDCVVRQCAPGMDFDSCGTEIVHCIGCKRGTWHKNPDGTWACRNATGLHDIDAVSAKSGPQCGSGDEGEM